MRLKQPQQAVLTVKTKEEEKKTRRAMAVE
jgi:hypothetical protein